MSQKMSAPIVQFYKEHVSEILGRKSLWLRSYVESLLLYWEDFGKYADPEALLPFCKFRNPFKFRASNFLLLSSFKVPCLHREKPQLS